MLETNTIISKKSKKASSKKSIVIGIINQKGGVGKTTITTLLANLFHFYFNYKVAIIDADMPQHSIIKRRREEINQIRENPKLKSLFKKLYLKLKETKDIVKPITVIPADIKSVNEILEQHKSEHDIIFIDIAGTVNQVGIIDVFKNIHHFFIPIFEDSDTLSSSFEFYRVIDNHVIPQSSNFKSAHFFFNRVSHMNRINTIQSKVESIGPLLSQKVYNYKAYERKLRSTVFPIPLQTERNPFNKEANLLFSFAKDVAQVIEYHYATVSEFDSKAVV